MAGFLFLLLPVRTAFSFLSVQECLSHAQGESSLDKSSVGNWRSMDVIYGHLFCFLKSETTFEASRVSCFPECWVIPSTYLRGCMHAKLLQLCPTLCSQSYGLTLCPWDSSVKYTGVGCHALLQGIFLTQGSNLHLLCLLNWQTCS